MTYSAEVRRRALSMVAGGMTVDEASEAMGGKPSRATIYEWSRGSVPTGTRSERSKLTAFQKEGAVLRVEAGERVITVAADMGCSVGALCRWRRLWLNGGVDALRTRKDAALSLVDASGPANALGVEALKRGGEGALQVAWPAAKNTNVQNRKRLNGKKTTLSYDSESLRIAEVTAQCFERRGVSKTSITDISSSAHITRELFYYYYTSKADVLNVVVAGYVTTIAACLRAWAEEYAGTGAKRSRKAAVDLVGVIRGLFYEDGGRPSRMHATLKEAGVALEAIRLACDECARESAVSLNDLHLCPNAYALAFIALGILGVLEASFETPDDMLASTILALG